MNCTELKERLMPYLDGELEPSIAAEVEKALADCPECRDELAEMKRVVAFSHQAIASVVAPAASANLDGVFSNVMARIEAEAKQASLAAAGPGFWARVGAWFSEVVRFERPMVLVGMAAALLASVVLLSGGGDAVPGVSGGPSLAGSVDNGAKRRGAEGEVKAVSRGGVFVEKLEAQKGKAFIDFDQNDPEAPMVLWHVMDGEGIQAPKGL